MSSMRVFGPRPKGKYRWAAALAGVMLALSAGPAFANEWTVVHSREIELPSGFTLFSNADQPVHLPANARGVLFRASAPPAAGDFVMTVAGGSRAIKVSIVPMRAVFIKPQGAMDNMAAPSDGLFRIEPVNGFEAARDYVVRYQGEPALTMNVHIDEQRVDVRDAFVSRVGEANRENLMHPSECGASPYGVAVSQAFRIEGSAQWQRYHGAMLTLLLPAAGTPWFIQDALQEQGIRFNWQDRRALRMGENQIRYLCAGLLGEGKSDVGMTAALAFLEIEDAWREAKPVTFSLAASSLTHYDSLDYLKAAMRTKQAGTIAAALRRIPVRASDEAVSYRTTTILERLAALRHFATDRQALSRRSELRRVIAQLAGQPDETVRAAANAALDRITLEPLRIETADEK